MGIELLFAVMGPLLGASLGISTFFYKRSVSRVDNQLSSLSDSMDTVLEQVIDLKIALPEKYVSREELSFHISMEDRWQNEMMAQLREIKHSVENSSSRSYEHWSHRPNPHNIPGEEIRD